MTSSGPGLSCADRGGRWHRSKHGGRDDCSCAGHGKRGEKRRSSSHDTSRRRSSPSTSGGVSAATRRSRPLRSDLGHGGAEDQRRGRGASEKYPHSWVGAGGDLHGEAVCEGVAETVGSGESETSPSRDPVESAVGSVVVAKGREAPCPEHFEDTLDASGRFHAFQAHYFILVGARAQTVLAGAFRVLEFQGVL